MAFSTFTDAKLVLNEILFYIDQNFGGIDNYGLWIFAKILPEDKKAILDLYYQYKQTRLGLSGLGVAKTTSNTVGPNETTYVNGGQPAHASTQAHF